uniref:Uncharacterized protein n=1 Tax=Anguilla anguilla TaxID=7936 RepID=A0A0E9RPR1_ANGAN
MLSQGEGGRGQSRSIQSKSNVARPLHQQEQRSL